MSRLDDFLEFYNGLNSSGLHRLAELYHPNVVFTDPVHQLHGSAALANYFEHAYARLNQCHFESKTRCEQGDSGFISWQMTLAHQAIGNGKLIQVEGCTELRWHQDGRILYHRDYYDLTELVYQHLPVIGWATNTIKQRMAKAH
ncbi:MAG: nuclear transport factor 2 family protein [Alkalimonas sp.]|uniref:Nuclear transport factor 2 family protein n=1 Tax=Alkalimonas delamerensis TaxID=265981 RepID=A0ABT9GPG1_9GAMM|nr:nuclear transport factor 2 family protein [Alkalimonas delamerensis]MCC5851329.1 nuclear transport factor 2 family protein [Alkalimonas sp.]MDP4528852.1 nuclear transport factor 2 family protein [Alkalimonas delamerensis]